MSGGIEGNIGAVLGRIERAALKSGRKAGDIMLLAVSKTASPQLVREAFRAGQRHFAESRVQEARAKMKELEDLEIDWQFIGHLQINKARAAVGCGFSLIHSVDSKKLLLELEREAARAGRVQRALLEVKLSPEETKHGVEEEGLMELLIGSGKTKHMKIEGLMTIPPYSDRPEDSRPYFRRLRELRDRAEGEGFRLPELSMGMSNDFEIAIEEGSTIVRVGTAIFGERGQA